MSRGRVRGTVTTVAVLAACLAMTGCVPGKPGIAARVGSVTITKGQLNLELSALVGDQAYLARLQLPGGALGDGPDGYSPTFVARVLASEINAAAQTALLDKRHAAPLPSGPARTITAATFQQTFGGLSLAGFSPAYRNVLYNRTAVDLGLEASLTHVDLSMQTMLAYRNAHLDQFARYCVSVVLRPTRAAAAASRHQIAAGTPVGRVARRASLDPSAVHDGRLGCGTSGMFDAAFTHDLVVAPVGTASAPIHDPQGWYVVVVTKRQVRSVDEAAADIVSALTSDDLAAIRATQSYLRTAKVAVAKTYGHFDPSANPPTVVIAAG